MDKEQIDHLLLILSEQGNSDDIFNNVTRKAHSELTQYDAMIINEHIDSLASPKRKRPHQTGLGRIGAMELLAKLYIFHVRNGIKFPTKWP